MGSVLVSVAFFFVTINSTGVIAQSSNTGSVLLEECALAIETDTADWDTLEAYKAGLCNGIVSGVLSTSVFLSAVCTPPEVTVRQAGRVVLTYLNDHPEELHESDATLALRALQEAFPCQ